MAIEYAKKNGKEISSFSFSSFFDLNSIFCYFGCEIGWKFIVQKAVDHSVQPIGWRGYKHNFLPQAVSFYFYFFLFIDALLMC